MRPISNQLTDVRFFKTAASTGPGKPKKKIFMTFGIQGSKNCVC